MKIKFGCTRTVFLFKNNVLKIPRAHHGWKFFLLGIIANLNEKEWSSYGLEMLAPVKFCSPFGLFLIMQRAEELKGTEIDYDKFKSIPLDPHEANFGLIDGKIVCFDYGENIESIICPKCNLYWDEANAAEYLSKTSLLSDVKNENNENQS